MKDGFVKNTERNQFSLISWMMSTTLCDIFLFFFETIRRLSLLGVGVVLDFYAEQWKMILR